MINKIIHSVEFKSLLLQLRTVYNRTPGSKPSIPVEIRLFIAHRVKYVLTGRIKCIFFSVYDVLLPWFLKPFRFKNQ